ncbi:MAG: DEAD/DEAH box helicase family protein [Ignavibacteria bacterium]|nr:DEAD/DEAH box helicase family protein [Ignavibacteria bacterium]
MLPPNPLQVELFMSLFRGRSDAYARRWEKEGRSGYSPAYEFSWNEFMAHKRRGGSLKDFENKKLLPLTDEVIKKHLLGVQVIGVYPILPDNTSYFLAADFDGEHWLEEAIAFIDASSRVQLNTYLERSRSGNGGHVWIFFSEPCPCYKSRQIGLELVRRAFNISEFEKEISFDRFFPNQDTLSKAGFGNLIALPFQGRSISQGNTVFLDLETGAPFADQWMFLREAQRHSTQEIDAVHQRLIVQKSGSTVPTALSGNSLTISVANQIVLARSELVPELVTFLKEELNFLNTEYLTKRRLGKSTYKVQKYFKLIEESGDAVSIPRGFLSRLVTFLNDHVIGHSVRRDYPLLGEVPFKSCIELTPFQTEVVDSALEHDQGVIVAPSGSGKTVIGLELIARRKLPALILVHRKQIFDQWVERIQEFLGIPKGHIGEYSGIKKKIGNQITVGLLQSLGRKKDLSEFKSSFGTILVDECHHIPASTFRDVVAQLSTHYLYGLTATPKRKHNDEKLIYVYIGDIVARMETTDSNPVPSPPSQSFEVVVRGTDLAIPFKFTTDLFQLLAKVICFDTARNKLIVDDILKETSAGNKVLVLSERKEHLEILNLYLKGKCETIVISGDDSLRARKSKVKQIEDGHYQVILSTGQFFGEGVDIHGISCLILAFPFSFEGKLVQYIGRLRDIGAQRLIIDYRDRKIPFLERQFKQRERYYKKVAAKISSKDPAEMRF